MFAPDILLAAIGLFKSGHRTEAEALLRDVLELEPDNPHALFLLGESALLAHRWAEAEGLLRRSMLLRPEHRGTRLGLARAQLSAGRPSGALLTLEPLAEERSLAQVQFLRGTAFNALKRPAEAAAALECVLAVTPDDPEALLNCGNAYAELDEHDLAETLIRRAIACRPDLAEAHTSLADLLIADGRTEEAIAACRTAIALQPDLAAAHWNEGVALLLNGDFSAGWKKYEWRKHRFPESFVNPPGPRWTGESLAGKTILVMAEQGIGDTIMFSRYLPLLRQRGADVVLQCAPSLIPLLGAIEGIRAIHPRASCAYDFWVDQMSLPLLFNTDLATIPAPSGYLRPDSARAARWEGRLPAGMRIGVAWAGNPLHSNDRRRSMPAQTLAPIVSVARNRLVSLQVGPRAQELPRLYGVPDFSPRLRDWAETAALISQLDLVISVDTAVAHLAAAIGIPVWLMLPYTPDWRWMLDRDDSPWYSCMTLYRQTKRGDWAGVAERVATSLGAVARPPQAIAIPPLTWSVAPVTQPASADAR